MKSDDAIDALDRERAANWLFRVLAALLDPAFLTPEWRTKLKNADVDHLHLAARYCRLIGSIVAVTRTRLLKHDDFLGMAGFDKMWHSVMTVRPEALLTVRLIRLIAESLELPVVGFAASDDWPTLDMHQRRVRWR